MTPTLALLAWTIASALTAVMAANWLLEHWWTKP